MNYFARDLYPESGMLETSLLSVPDSTEQRTLETDEKAVEVAEQVTGTSKRGIFTTVAICGAVILLLGFLHKGV